MTFINLVRIELMKTWRSRWIVFAVMGGIFLLIAGGLYTYYVISQHRWNPPPAVAWQTTLRQEIATNQQSITQLQQIKQTQPSGGFRGGFSIDDEIKREQQAIADDQYLIDNNIAPLQSFSITLAALFALGGIVMFLLIRIFGWLASEEIAGERSDRTIAILLSRPMSRDQLLLAKAVASFLISLAVVVVTFFIVYGMVAFIEGSIGPIQGQVGIAVDGTKAVGAGNLVVDCDHHPDQRQHGQRPFPELLLRQRPRPGVGNRTGVRKRTRLSGHRHERVRRPDRHADRLDGRLLRRRLAAVSPQTGSRLVIDP